MKLGRAPTTLITLSINYQQSLSENLSDNFVPAKAKMLTALCGRQSQVTPNLPADFITEYIQPLSQVVS